MDRSVRLLGALVLAPLLAVVAGTKDPAAHQGAITAAAAVAAVLAVRVARREGGFALAAGIGLWTAGSATMTVLFVLERGWEYAGIAQLIWLASYPVLWIAIMLLVRASSDGWGAGHWLDGVVACLGVAAVGAAILLPQMEVVGVTGATAALLSAFAIGDLLLLGATATAIVLLRRWSSPTWRLLALGMLGVAGTDLLFALRLAGAPTLYSSEVDVGWVLGLFALACVGPASAVRGPRRELHASRYPLVPAFCTVAALVVLVVDHYHRLPESALWLAVLTLALGVVRTVESARTGGRLAEAERLALTDDLTRMGNRRRLFRDLGAALERGESTRLTLFDLDGFKAHNDTFGHVAGDELLAELGRKLDAAVEGAGAAYRLGGDEFCVLLDADRTLTDVHAALRSEFVTASYGSVLLPAEAGDPTQALRIADARMYADKAR